MKASGRVIATATALVAFACASTASAKTFVVTKRGDPPPNGCHKHDCSLREAIIAANHHGGGDTVVLPNHKTYDLSIPNSDPVNGEDAGLEGDLDVTGRLSVEHPGAGKARVDANGIDRAFDVFARTTLTRIVVAGGTAPGQSGGGGIRAIGDLVLRRSAVVGNSAPALNTGGGGIGLVSSADLTLIRSTVARNDTGGDGGGVDGNDGLIVIKRSKIVRNTAGFGAGGVHFFSESTRPSRVIKSTIAGNQSGEEGGGIEISSEAVAVKDSTISGNESAFSGGGIAVFSSRLSAVNSTFAANRAAGPGGGIAVDTSGRANLNAVTVARNHADSPGGGLFYGPSSPGFDVRNSLIALNTSPTAPDCAGDAFDSHGHNVLSSDTGCAGFDAPGDIVRADPKIGTLGHHGGPTKTVPLKKHSPAIGHANRSTSPKRDQRGHKRDRHPDSGAFER